MKKGTDPLLLWASSYARASELPRPYLAVLLKQRTIQHPEGYYVRCFQLELQEERCFSFFTNFICQRVNYLVASLLIRQWFYRYVYFAILDCC